MYTVEFFPKKNKAKKIAGEIEEFIPHTFENIDKI